MKRIASVIASLLVPALATAQDQVEMADTMRSNGKIYVVVAIILVILTGLLTYVILMDRKVSRLEKKADELSRASRTQ